MSKYLVTSALPYANGYIHLGHLAGAYLPADIYVRFLRLKGEQVLYVCGSDEHGVAITIAAEKEKVTPQDIIDKYHFSNLDAFKGIGISFDIYSRTSKPAHHQTAREFFQDFLLKGYLIPRENEQFFDNKAQMFLPDRYVEGICPNCGNESARGDQCDNCGAYYSQTELKNPKSLISGENPILKKTVHWYFQFDKFQEFLEKYIEDKSSVWKDNVIQQTKSWLKAGLTERAITRDLTWGIEIAGLEGVDDEIAKGKRLYVWFDAVLGYISATKEYFGDDRWKEWWQGEDTKYIAFIGKDNIVFHTLIFPAMLHGRTDENNKYILPSNVPANEFLNLEGQKFSKSRNWSIDLGDFLKDFDNPFLRDNLRYTLAMNFPENKDADFTWRDFVARNNNELASILGNFINRTLQFLHKNFEGKVPELNGDYVNFKEEWNKLIVGNEYNLEENDSIFLNELKSEFNSATENWSKFKFRDGIVNIMNIARSCNKYFNDEEPWKTVKQYPEKSAKTLFVCTNMVYNLSILFSPILPNTSEYIKSLFDKSKFLGESNGKLIQDENLWQKSLEINLNSGENVIQPNIIFSRLEDSFIELQQSKLGNKKMDLKEEELITIDDFMKVKLKTAKIISAERVKKSDKLLKLQVEIGEVKRQILAGIGKKFNPEEIIGRTIIVVANLKPAKLMGEESQGMMLAANDGESLFLAGFDSEVNSGLEVR